MINELINEIIAHPAFQEVMIRLENANELDALGLPRSARMGFLAAVSTHRQSPILLVTDRTDRCLKLVDELRFWLPDQEVQYFPEPTPMFYEQASWGALVRRDRLQSLTRLASYHIPQVRKPINAIFVAPIRAIMTRTLPRRDFIKGSNLIKKGRVISPESLQRNWVDIGYQSVDIVVEMGQFSRRGGLLDIWTPSSWYPVRLDFFGDEIETIRSFDPATQRTVANVDEVLITPAREILPGKAISVDAFPQEIDEFYLPLIHPARASIMDYLPLNTLIFVDDQTRIRATADEIETQSISIREENTAEGIIAEDFPVPYLSWSEILDSISGLRMLDMGFSVHGTESHLAEHFNPGPRFGGRLKQVKEHINQLCVEGETSYIVSRQVLRLKDLCRESVDPDFIKKQPVFIEGALTEGWRLSTEVGEVIHLLTDGEIFGWDRPEPRRRRQRTVEAPETIFADLKPEDWVVHIDYGVGRFSGLVKRTVDGSEREFLMIEYDGGAQIYVPVHQADRLSKYIGPTADPPSPTRLGTADWSRAKGKVRESVEIIARDLLALYATRQVSTGFAFSPDSQWQEELESAFPYIETADQLQAIREVKKDMETPRPMDRLLCGDVGYGKTEVALRAAFKSVMDSKQVGVLVPTTVLAQQHYETFLQRLAPFPVEVEMLSRFRTQKQQGQIVERLHRGEIDIVIGTHRLIQPDVQFKDLGLLIIDEEQRFGVTHKEHFKKLRTEIDVLTLTATPIPRTLYMALTGVRDISTIETPPEERLPIVTHIGPYSTRLVRQAIMRELERGGQVFFVHNRVRSIRAMERHLQKLVPEARIGVGHGQMPEKALENVMHQFTRGEIDVLLCTSIIESGLDIPNANTLIVDRGDTFGLSQLYQLRGRVGRSAQRAHAYFFRHRKRLPTPEGLERLETIAENTQLGSGYSIAMRDLEMRGAGELLGTQQHGNIASVGFHLYTQLLAQAVREVKQEGSSADIARLLKEKGISNETAIPVIVDLSIPVGIPVDYISNQNLRLKLYRRLANLTDIGDLEKTKEEFVDRFGPLPETVENLFYQLWVKVLGRAAGLASITTEGNQIVFRYPPLTNGRNGRDLPEVGFGLRVGKNAYRLITNETDEWQDTLIDILNAIKNVSDGVDSYIARD